jgi:hypothetical protein
MNVEDLWALRPIKYHKEDVPRVGPDIVLGTFILRLADDSYTMWGRKGQEE